ncbi:MAG: electron transfer flavoprotein subunit beta/FixA family protein [Desulfuromonadales bacterium]|nr:electron transfer flavoprotein subunit beta/FixA family protein [Desulfuromonadales bacterium]
MKVLVCIKQVPDMESRFKLNAAGNWYDTADLAWRMNEYDEFAVEQAVLLKEKAPDTELVALSIGPERVKEAMKKALAMGIDRGVHVQDEASFEKDPYQIASVIAEYARNENFDLILTGMQSQDRGSAQVGILVGEMLGLPAVSTVVGFALDGQVVTAKRELEGGLKAVVKVGLPALFTCQLGLNTPRYPTLPNIMKAKKKELTAIPVATLLKDEALAVTEKVSYPEKRGSGLVLEGEIGELTTKLVALLKEKTSVFK